MSTQLRVILIEYATPPKLCATGVIRRSCTAEGACKLFWTTSEASPSQYGNTHPWGHRDSPPTYIQPPHTKLILSVLRSSPASSIQCNRATLFLSFVVVKFVIFEKLQGPRNVAGLGRVKPKRVINHLRQETWHSKFSAWKF